MYRALYDDFDLYVRPYDMFVEKTDKKKYPLVEQEDRFQLIEIKARLKILMADNVLKK